MKTGDLQPKLLYPAKLSFGTKGQIKSFPDKKILKECLITKPLLYEMLKGLIEEKGDQNMTNKMVINTHSSTIESKKQPGKQEERQSHGCRENFDGCQMGEGVREWVKK